MILNNEALWVEKYRPRVIEDCVLRPDIKKMFGEIVKTRKLGNLLLVGTQGTGKTTVAKALCRSLDFEFLFINASEDNGIDILRTRIRQFASSISMNGDMKVVILDEADHLTSSVQPALRGFIEEFSNNCRFIFTCNYKNKIIEPLHSRCAVVDFNTNKQDLSKLAGHFMKRMEYILNEEKVEYTPAILAELIIKYSPDWRRIQNECQRYVINGKLDIASLVASSDISKLVKHLADKDFKSMRSWVVNNGSIDGLAVFRQIYDGLNDIVETSSIPAAILILAEYSYKSSFMVDKELNLVACLTEIMSNVTFKK